MDIQPAKDPNPKDRAGQTRLDMTLFPQTAIAYGALAMVEGHAKYGGFNFRNAPVKASVYLAACMRHLFKWYGGEHADPSTKVPHLGSALACIAIAVDAWESKTMVDDRPPATADMESLFKEFEEVVKHLYSIYPTGPERYTQAALDAKAGNAENS